MWPGSGRDWLSSSAAIRRPPVVLSPSVLDTNALIDRFPQLVFSQPRGPRRHSCSSLAKTHGIPVSVRIRCEIIEHHEQIIGRSRKEVS